MDSAPSSALVWTPYGYRKLPSMPTRTKIPPATVPTENGRDQHRAGVRFLTFQIGLPQPALDTGVHGGGMQGVIDYF
jgi:hypothetical protein